MLRSPFGLLFALGVSFVLASACGSEDAKKRAMGDDAGAAGVAGEAGQPASGGSSMGRAGEPAVTEGGAGGAPAAVGGAGGAPEAMGGAGGAPMPSAGAGGETAAGGAGGAPSECCQPLECPAATLNDPCGYYLDDGCGESLYCGCSPGFECNDAFTCDSCVPDVEFCTNNQYNCGDTVDNCGNPITCPDNCSSQTSGGKCVDGQCCGAKFQCDSDSCGMVDDYCGGLLDCTANTCDGSQCINGSCCIPNVQDPCVEVECGFGWDGCQEVDCGNPCQGTDACIQGSCQNSVCKTSGYECGSVENPVIGEGDEYCGSCPAGQSCSDHHCVTLCEPPIIVPPG